MSGGRIAAHIEVFGLIRRAEAGGGGGMVLARGDRDSGAILVALAERGVVHGILERTLGNQGRYEWGYRITKDIEQKQSVNGLIAARRANDPDLWVVELDIPCAEQFAAQMTREG